MYLQVKFVKYYYSKYSPKAQQDLIAVYISHIYAQVLTIDSAFYGFKSKVFRKKICADFVIIVIPTSL